MELLSRFLDVLPTRCNLKLHCRIALAQDHRVAILKAACSIPNPQAHALNAKP